jgi:hypothetical protein
MGGAVAVATTTSVAVGVGGGGGVSVGGDGLVGVKVGTRVSVAGGGEAAKVGVKVGNSCTATTAAGGFEPLQAVKVMMNKTNRMWVVTRLMIIDPAP